MEGPKRIYFLDGFRAITIFLVIVLHAALAFVNYYGFVQDMVRDNIVRFIYIPLDGCVLMSAMFFAAGFFTPGSLAKKGPAGFLIGKLIRIGIPFARGTFDYCPDIIINLLLLGVDGPLPGLSPFQYYQRFYRACLTTNI